MNHSLDGWHPSAFHLPHGILCNRPPPDTHVNLAQCLSHLRHMPMSLSPDAYVAKVRCLCRPVYRCSGRPFFVLFGHFRHEMRIFPASEASFGADGGWPEQSANGRGGRRAHVVGGGRRTEASAICTQPPLFAHGLRSLYTGSALCTRAPLFVHGEFLVRRWVRASPIGCRRLCDKTRIQSWVAFWRAAIIYFSKLWKNDG